MHTYQFYYPIELFPWVTKYATTAIILIIGAAVGFLSGLLGKGGSAITTPALQIFAGINPLVALASPLPAALPTTLSASLAYRKQQVIDRRVVFISISTGIPSTIAGSYYSDWFGGKVLMILTALFVLGLGISFFIFKNNQETVTGTRTPIWKISLVGVSVVFLSGLLANSGGVLFGPLFIRYLKLPTKEALSSSLIVAAGLAVPGTVAHWYLGHIDWEVVLFLSVGSIPFSYLGASVSLQIHHKQLEKVFGIVLIILGVLDLWYNLF